MERLWERQDLEQANLKARRSVKDEVMPMADHDLERKRPGKGSR